jgi:hypothetical protein
MISRKILSHSAAVSHGIFATSVAVCYSFPSSVLFQLPYINNKTIA